MKIEPRKNKTGCVYYSFVYYHQESKKRVRITKEEIRKRFGKDITDYEEAVNNAKILDAEKDSLKKRIDKRLTWEGKFYEIPKLLKLYEEHQRKKAPNSFKNNMHYLKHYVLPYFLTIKSCNNISQWSDFYDEFKDWLENDARLVKNQNKKLSYASMNHAIKAVNTFSYMLYKQKVLDKHFSCEAFPEYKLREKGVGDVISEDEMEAVYAQLKRSDYLKEAIFFRCLYFTGMRFNEGYGLHPGNLYEGVIEDERLTDHIERAKWEYFGYLVFDSQPSHATRGLRDINGVVHRKPLKGRKKIDDKSARTLVIRDQVLWNDLIDLYNKAIEAYENRVFGAQIEQYPIFEGIDKSTSTVRLKKAFEACGLKYRSWHCCRHTRATMISGESDNSTLLKLWLGHTSDKVMRKYVHINESIIRTVKKGRILKKLGSF